MKIAVYGTLRKGHGNHHCLGDSPLLGTCILDGFSMVSLGGFPAIDYDPKGQVVVEVYEVDSEAEARCNRLEGYVPGAKEQSFYDRVPVQTHWGEAQVYIIRGVLHESYRPVPSGNWNNVVSPRDGERIERHVCEV